MKIIVSRCGPYMATREGDDPLASTGTKNDVVRYAKAAALAAAQDGSDTVVELVDAQGRPVSIWAFYADEVGPE